MRYIYLILLIFIGLTVSAQLPLKTFEKASSNNMFIGVDATDSLAQWKPLSGIGYSPLADSSKWTVSGTNLFPKSLSYNVGIGLNNPAQQLELTGSFRTPATTSSTTGVWYKGTTPFIHNFQHPTGNTAIPVGRNTFIGIESGNFTMGSTATSTSHSSYNVGIGYRTLLNNTIGYQNVSIGYQSLFNNTSGYRNIGLGYLSLFSNTEGFSNYAAGYQALYYNTTGSYNVAIGYNAMILNVDGAQNMAIGMQSLYSNTSGGNNVGIGRNSLFTNSSGNGNVGIGYQSLFSNSTGLYNVGIGYNAGFYETGSNKLYISNQPGTDESTGRSKAIIYGEMSATTANQILGFNASVGIGTITPAAQFHTTGTVRLAGAGTPGAGKVLTSDADGDATWETVAAGGIDSTVVTAGFGIGVSEVSNNFTVRNTRYWSGQDTLKTTLTGLVKATSGVLTAVTDNSSNWNTAYGWGNHASAGYLTSETGDISSVSVTSPITGGGTSGAVTIGINNADANGSTKGAASFTANDFNASSGNISIDYTNGQAASGSNKGFLTSSDWTTFNGKFTLPALTSGSVLFSNGTTIAQDNANLYWDDSNNRLGLGTTSPSYIFHAKKAGSVIGLFEGTGGSGAFGGVEVKADAGTGNYSGYTLSHGTGSYYLQYNTTDGLKIFPDIDQQSLPISFRTYQGNTRFVINPGTNQIGVYDGTNIDYGSDGEFLGKTPSGYAWTTPTMTLPTTVAARYYSTGTLSISTSYQKIPFNTATFNNGGFSISSSQITVPEIGTYQVLCQFVVTENNTGSAELNYTLYKNDNPIQLLHKDLHTRNYPGTYTISDFVTCQTNDTLDVRVTKTGDGVVTVSSQAFITLIKI